MNHAFSGRIATLLLVIFSSACLSQERKFRPFIRTNYPSASYSIKSDTFHFRDYTIHVVQVRSKKPAEHQQHKAACRIWLFVKKDSVRTDQLYYNDCEALGGCSGIFVAGGQPSEKHFILSKFGDYNGQLLMIDTNGKIRTYAGGRYYLSHDKRYLFSFYDSDQPGATVFDLKGDRLLYTSDSLQKHLMGMYRNGKTYFATLAGEREEEKVSVVVFDFKTRKFISDLVTSDYIARSKPMKGYNQFQYAPCDCGRKE